MLPQHRITTIISTSPIPSLPATDHIELTVESLAMVAELEQSPLIIAFDGADDSVDKNVYDMYKHAVMRKFAMRKNVRFVMLEAWGHLSGVLRAALGCVATQYVFVQQHDLPIVRAFDLDAVLCALGARGDVKHVRLNSRCTEAIGWDKSPLFGPVEGKKIGLTRTSCWSDQSHFSTLEYYTEVILPRIANKAVFPETVLNPFRKLPVEELLSIHRVLGTYIYGFPGEQRIVAHTDARRTLSPSIAREETR